MKLFVIYDIEDNRVRNKVADACLDYGLARVQFSTFFGEASRARQDELAARIGRLVGRQQAYVVLLPICERDIAAMREIGAPLCRLPFMA